MKKGYNELVAQLGMEKYTQCIGYNCRSMVTFTPAAGNILEVKALMQQEMIKRGILWAGFHNMMYSHTHMDIQYTLKTYANVLLIVKEAIESEDVKSYLIGEPLEPVFRKVSDYNIKPVKKKLAKA